MFSLAFFSFHFIETPFRDGWGASRPMILASGIGLIIGSAAIVHSISNKLGSYLYLDQSDPWVKKLPETDEMIKHCNIYNNLDLNCGYKDSKNRNTIFMIGDSHIDQFADHLLPFAKKQGYNLIRATGPLCPFPVTQAMVVVDHCRQVQKKIRQNIVRMSKSGDLVFIGTAVTLYFLSSNSEDGKPSYPHLREGIDASRAVADYKQNFLRLSRELNNNHVKVVFFLDGPRFHEVLEGYGFCRSPWFAPKRGEHPGCSTEKEPFVTWRNLNFGWLNSWRDIQQRFVMDGLTDQICDDQKCRADIYIDNNHFDPFYASHVFDSFASRLGKSLIRL